jgi:choline dehydrogenase-like flavoprotein
VRTEESLAALATLPYGPNRVGLFSAHVNGTCRIGRDPRTSGCAPDGQRHGVRGLYVADGSLLPTAPGVNPQETIMAVATVVARRIHERHAR